MGDVKKPRKQYSSPRRPWDKKRIVKESKIMREYGLKAKRELWRFETIIKGKKHNARTLLALPIETRTEKEKELFENLYNLGILDSKATLDDVLGLTLESILERRLQTVDLRKGLAITAHQARQFITHGHISVNKKKVSSPGYLVKRNEEDMIEYFGQTMELGAAIVEKKENK